MIIDVKQNELACDIIADFQERISEYKQEFVANCLAESAIAIKQLRDTASIDLDDAISLINAVPIFSMN